MIRATNEIIIDIENNKRIANLFGTSEDTKPTTGFANGATFLEVDTGKIYLFNEDASEWVELS